MTGTDDDAGVPVRIAIAALLGTTLLVSAGVGASIWGATPNEQEMPPRTQFDANETTTNLTVEGERVEVRAVTFRHGGGDSVDASNLAIEVSREGEARPWTGLDADGTPATFEGGAATKGSEATIVAGAPEGSQNVTFAIEVDDRERRLTDSDGTVIELQPGDAVSIVWFDDGRSATLARINIE